MRRVFDGIAPVELGSIAGIDVYDWIDLFVDSHNRNEKGWIVGSDLRQYPDGDSLLQQETILLQVFKIIRHELEAMHLEKQKRGKR